MKRITLNDIAKILLGQDNILILTHCFPDGDTLGSAYALCAGLQQLGRHARVICSDDIPQKYHYMQNGIINHDFSPEFIVAVDVADPKLLGNELSKYSDCVQLCIDHHRSNTMFAENTYVDSAAAATCEVIYELLSIMDIKFNLVIAACIYTGITTDTGCFKYSNVTPKTHRTAALMMSEGVDAAEINRIMFDTKSRARIELEREVMDHLEYHCDGLCALITITKDMLERTGANEGDIEGLSSLPLQIEGVKIGLTFREKNDGDWKLSARTIPGVDASALCAVFGGGGHRQAAGCNLSGAVNDVKKTVLDSVWNVLGG